MAFLGPSLRRKRVTDRPAARVAAAALVSLALNALAVLLLARLGAFELASPMAQTRVAVQPLSAEQWNANRAIASAPGAPAVQPPASVPSPQAPPPQPPRPVPPPEKPAQGQVVDVAPSKDSRPPDGAKYLSDRSNRVEKETRSRWAGTQVWEKRAAAPTEGDKGRQEARERGEGGDAREARQEKAGQEGANGRAGKRATPAQPERAPEPAPSSSDERLAMLEPPSRPGLLQPGQPSEPRAGEEGLGKPGAPGEAQAGQRKAGDPRLLPSVESMSRIAAGPSADYVDRDVEVGEATALNTREFRFATFWNRFKQDVAERWIPAVSYNIHQRDPNGQLFGGSDRVTRLQIVLDGAGVLKDIKVTGSSGLDFLDRIAVKSVRDASPFYNVPPALLDRDGQLAFDFGFLVEGGRGIPVRPHWNAGP